ncbi:M23 family metallopeptidase [Leptospira alexanderi]|uniref:Peptidase, M23 family n=1 Tax=Leptospira alexanderi serovar Manhao 3 str. L 60 TaxID=1049759 RepID=V6IEQ0_9LEPT|nr:M23 family metallopeptidase [Leptospira alexanderi]EQA62883.1 peptidase, M23 family [Leptospira alexanderi serovar Manhao 3 str. L 60]
MISPAKYNLKLTHLERLQVKILKLKNRLQKFKESGSKKISFLLVPHSHENVIRIELNVFTVWFLGILSGLILVLAFVFLSYLNFFYRPDHDLFQKSDENVSQYLYYDMLLQDAKKEIHGLERKTEQLNLVAWDEVPWKRILTYEAIPEFHLKKEIPDSETNLELYKNTVEGFAIQNIELFRIRQAFENAFDYLEERESILYALPRGRPLKPGVGFVSSTFGGRVDPFGLVVLGEHHSGVDFASAEGTPIYATAPGIVVESGQSSGGLGKNIRINHLNGIFTVYGHCSQILVEKNQIVKRGDLIGLVGSTGKATGPHVHYEVHIGQDPPLDPAEFINIE